MEQHLNSEVLMPFPWPKVTLPKKTFEIRTQAFSDIWEKRPNLLLQKLALEKQLLQFKGKAAD